MSKKRKRKFTTSKARLINYYENVYGETPYTYMLKLGKRIMLENFQKKLNS